MFNYTVKQLMNSAKHGQYREVKRILCHKDIDVNVRHSLGWTALHVSSMAGELETVKVLLENGADVNLGDDFTNVANVAHKLRVHSIEGNNLHLLN